MNDRNKHIREIVRKLISEGLLPENFFSTPTTGGGTYTYSTPGSLEKSYNFQSDETLEQKAKRFGIPYSKFLKKLDDSQFENISALLDVYNKTGKLNIEPYGPSWTKNDFNAYLVDIISRDIKSGKRRGYDVIDVLFNPVTNAYLRENLIRNSNYFKKANEEGIIKNLSDNINSELVMKTVEKMNGLYVNTQIIKRYNNSERFDFFLPFLLNRLQLRFNTEYINLLEKIEKEKQPKEPKILKHVPRSYTISDIQKILYGGNDADGKNDNFIKFNQANKEAIAALTANKTNPIHIAIIDGMINSKLDTEEMVELYPQFFLIKDNPTKSRTKVGNAFLNLKNSSLAKYLDDLYKKHGLLNLPPVSKWNSKDISPSQTTSKLKADKFGGMFEEIRRIINNN